MIPVEKIASSSLGNLMYYVALIGVLLMVAAFLRLKIKFLRKAFIPASLLAGVIALLLGPRFIGLIPSDMMSTIGSLPSHMITVVFACMLLGVKKEEITPDLAKDTASGVFFMYSGALAQVGIACLITGLILTPAFGVEPLFGAIWECSFNGGHGTASGLIQVFQELGWPAGGDLAVTTATIGLLAGIIGGVIMINYAVRKKYTKYVDAPVAVGGSKEYFAEGERKSAAPMTVSNDVIEPFALHLGMIGLAILIGRVIVWLVGKYLNYSLPLFPFAMIGGWILNIFIQRNSFLSALFDRQVFQRISGMALEILIVGAIASINTSIILQYWLPLLLMSIIEIGIMVWFVFYVSPRCYKKDWFENGIVRYGGMTGVAATGYMLLRCCDPEYSSEGGTTLALDAPFTSPFIGGGFVTTACPYLIISMGVIPFGALITAIAVACLVVLRVFFWKKNPTKQQRE